MTTDPARDADCVALPSTPEVVCEDCGGPGVTWEDDVHLCDDCARLRAKKSQMDRERTHG